MQASAWIGLVLALALTSPVAAAVPENGRFHHVHLNVGDIDRTELFYAKVFGTRAILYARYQPAMMADRSFIFLTEVHGPIRSANLTAVNHIGWGGVDGPSEFAWLKSQGVEFYTPLSP